MTFTLQIGRSSDIPFTPSASVAQGVGFVFTAKKRVDSAPVISTVNITYDYTAQEGVIHLFDEDTAPLTPGEWLCDLQAIVAPNQNYVIAETIFTARLPVRGAT